MVYARRVKKRGCSLLESQFLSHFYLPPVQDCSSDSEENAWQQLLSSTYKYMCNLIFTIIHSAFFKDINSAIISMTVRKVKLLNT